MTTEIARSRRARLDEKLASAPFDAYLAVLPANVDYATGYRSVAAAVHGRSGIGALVVPGRTVIAGPIADAPSVEEAGIAADDYLGYGTFYFESTDASPISQMVGDHAGFPAAIAAAIRHAGLSRSAIGIDFAGLSDPDLAALQNLLPDTKLTDSSAWARGVRGVKLPAEVTALKRAAQLTEDAITAAIDAARVGMTEQDLERIIAGRLVAGGLMPRFVVVTAGLRSAFADTLARADQKLAPGDLVRFDVGGILDGYWSDIGRTAVVGAPDEKQASRYRAILAGEEEQLLAAKPGVQANRIFSVAVDQVEALGLKPYRRHHCGHGIGLEVYEPPIISPGVDQELEAGMVFCFETPFYQLGWGGMMVEDTLVITDDGCELLTRSDRGLRVIDA